MVIYFIAKHHKINFTSKDTNILLHINITLFNFYELFASTRINDLNIIISIKLVKLLF